MFMMENDTIRNNVRTRANRHSTDSSWSDENPVTLRNRIRHVNLLRPRSLINLLSHTGSHRILQSQPSREDLSNDRSLELTENTKAETNKKGWNAIVTIVLVEAKGLPDPPSDSSAHNVYCKFRLGSETCKSKSVPSAHNPEWRERLEMHLNKDKILRFSLWDKGRQKNFMGSSVLDLSSLEKERSHDIWQQLDDGFGIVHLNITVCTVRNDKTCSDPEPNLECVKEVFALRNLNDWKVVGQLHVKLIGARGLSGKPNAYCTLELDNERVRTPNARASSEPIWNKTYVFNVYDVTSTLDIKVHDSSIVNLLRMESYLGKVSIPLLRISNRATRWYALKDKSKRNNAKGNCPRILLEMNIIWNPVKAAVKLFEPKEVKYIKKPPKFDIALLHSNLVFVTHTLHIIYGINESYKHFLEWENVDLSTVVLGVWLVFWINFDLWIVPLILLVPFLYFWFCRHYEHDISITRVRSYVADKSGQNDSDKNETSITDKIQNLPEMTIVITTGVEYAVSLAERIYNLVSFQVPFLSSLTMLLLVFASITLYLIPIKYLLMAFGTYKYARKRLNPNRTPNNDLLDFMSRIPDFEMLKDWKELSVPEPVQQRNSSGVQVNY